MPRLSFATRIGMIGVLSVGGVWIVAIALFVLSHGRDSGLRPPPAQIAAVAQLMEESSPAQRPLVLRAITSDIFAPRLEPAGAIGPSSMRPALNLGARNIKAYLAALDERRTSVTTPPPVPPYRLFGRLLGETLEFRIALRTGETLVIDTRAAMPVTLLGLPAGFGAGLLSTIVALAALLVMQREARPLARLAAAVDRIDLSGLPAALPETPRSAPEIRALVGAFDRLQTRLAQLLRARMAMLGGISHDVRSFATRLRLRVEHIPDAAERQRAVADIADMISLLDDALLASRISAGERDEELIALADFVQAEIAGRQAPAAAISLHVDPAAGGAQVLGDRVALRRITANLIDNALTYGHAARVAIAVDGSIARLVIDDDGPGIPPDQRATIFEPFARLETSRNRRTGGAGLGLAVVRNLVEAHRGSVTIGDSPTGGARITVCLPLFEPTWAESAATGITPPAGL